MLVSKLRYWQPLDTPTYINPEIMTHLHDLKPQLTTDLLQKRAAMSWHLGRWKALFFHFLLHGATRRHLLKLCCNNAMHLTMYLCSLASHTYSIAVWEPERYSSEVRSEKGSRIIRVYNLRYNLMVHGLGEIEKLARIRIQNKAGTRWTVSFSRQRGHRMDGTCCFR